MHAGNVCFPCEVSFSLALVGQPFFKWMCHLALLVTLDVTPCQVAWGDTTEENKGRIIATMKLRHQYIGANEKEALRQNLYSRLALEKGSVA